VDKLFKKDVVREIADKLQYYHRDVQAVLDSFATMVANHVRQGEIVGYAKLGTFSPQLTRRKNDRGRRVVKFLPANALTKPQKGVDPK
jgi:nucleoid DNA-binding protein